MYNTYIYRYHCPLWMHYWVHKEAAASPHARISFFKNGKFQGYAFEDIWCGTYYPAASFYYGGCATANFGPEFRFPPKCPVSRSGVKVERAEGGGGGGDMYGTVRSATRRRSCSCGTKSLWRRKGSALAAYLALALALLLLPFLRPLLVFRPHITISPYKPIYYFFPSIFLCSSLTHPLPLSSPSLPPPYHPYIIIII